MVSIGYIMPGLTISNACLCYHYHIIFEQFDFHLPHGSWTCLLGASGVGKSSLLRLIVGFEQYHGMQLSGEVRCDDGLTLQGRIGYMARVNHAIWQATIPYFAHDITHFDKDKYQRFMHFMTKAGQLKHPISCQHYLWSRVVEVCSVVTEA